MTVKIYGGEACQQCDTTKGKFHRAKVEFDYEILTEEIKAQLLTVHEVLPRTLPILISEDQVYGFHQVDALLKELKAKQG